MEIVIDNRRRETYSDRLSIVGDNRPITSECTNNSMDFSFKQHNLKIVEINVISLVSVNLICHLQENLSKIFLCVSSEKFSAWNELRWDLTGTRTSTNKSQRNSWSEYSNSSFNTHKSTLPQKDNHVNL
jgi:hypothetical protein